MTAISVYGFETSNNMKVRVALGYKGVEYQFVAIDPGDRAEIVRISGQYLTPVLVHGDRVVFDSAAILRYLETAFPQTPKLFGDSHAQQWAIEDQELFARATLAAPMMEVVHRRVGGGSVDDAMAERCAAAFEEAVVKLAARLEGRAWLVGDRMSAADITAAAIIRRVEKAELFPIPQIVATISGWVDAVMRFDGEGRASG